MKPKHPQLADGRWFAIPFLEQMANIGSEIERTLSWKERNRADYAGQAFDRALELLDLTIADAKNRNRLRELTRVREMLADFLVFDNQYRSSAEAWRKYFAPFYFAVRR